MNISAEVIAQCLTILGSVFVAVRTLFNTIAELKDVKQEISRLVQLLSKVEAKLEKRDEDVQEIKTRLTRVESIVEIFKKVMLARHSDSDSARRDK